MKIQVLTVQASPIFVLIKNIGNNNFERLDAFFAMNIFSSFLLKQYQHRFNFLKLCSITEKKINEGISGTI